MTGDLVELIQAIVRDELRAYRTAELGVVTRVHSHDSAGDSNNYECDVRLRDSGLELKRVPICTQRVGAVAIPNPNDLVTVQFLQGDVHSAVITGRLHNDQVRSPEAKAHELVYICPDATESGIRRIYVELPRDNKMRVDDDQVVLEMGRTRLTIKHDGEVEVKTNNQDITLTDQSGANRVKLAVQQGQVTVQGQTKVVVEAPQVELVLGATHPLVFGDALLSYLTQIVTIFQAHMHVGELALGAFPVTPAPPAMPMPFPTPDLLSFKVKTG